MAARAGGALQITARKCRYLQHSITTPWNIIRIIYDAFSHKCFLVNLHCCTCVCPPGDQPGSDVGPLISPEAKARVESLIQSGADEGAKLLLDGRNVNVKGYENGNFVGPTILGNVTVS